eukprot:5579166-Pyramimonas_sp.AAC.1
MGLRYGLNLIQTEDESLVGPWPDEINYVDELGLNSGVAAAAGAGAARAPRAAGAAETSK